MSILDLFKKIEQHNKPEHSPVEWIIAGLGNPGGKYENTRHNVGFTALDCISEKSGTPLKNLKFSALCCKANIGGKAALLLKPQTFMNLSGQSISEAARFYKIKPENIIVIFDDAALNLGQLRVRRRGSDGGHNGIKNIIYHLNSDGFPHLKIGIGSPPDKNYDIKDWVLGKFTEKEKHDVHSAAKRAADAAEEIISNGIDSAMQKFNGV